MMQSIQELVGERLTAVCFSMGYVEFQFDGPVVRVLVPLALARNGVESTFPGEGGRDALCNLIESAVADIVLDEDVSLTVQFHSGATIMIPLEKKAELNPEAVHFVPGLNQPLQIF